MIQSSISRPTTPYLTYKHITTYWVSLSIINLLQQAHQTNKHIDSISANNSRNYTNTQNPKWGKYFTRHRSDKKSWHPTHPLHSHSKYTTPKQKKQTTFIKHKFTTYSKTHKTWNVYILPNSLHTLKTKQITLHR